MSSCFWSCIPSSAESCVFQQCVGLREKEELTDEELSAAQISLKSCKFYSSASSWFHKAHTVRQSLFDAASEGKDVVTFDQAASTQLRLLQA